MTRALTETELITLHDIGLRRVAAVWSTTVPECPVRGRKPWFAMTCGVLPTTLHTLWLGRLIRLDRSGAVVHCDGYDVARARLTPLGRRVLEANR